MQCTVHPAGVSKRQCPSVPVRSDDLSSRNKTSYRSGVHYFACAKLLPAKEEKAQDGKLMNVSVSCAVSLNALLTAT